MVWREGSPSAWGHIDRETVDYDSAVSAWKAVERRCEASIALHRAGIVLHETGIAAAQEQIDEARARILHLNRVRMLRTIDLAAVTVDN